MIKPKVELINSNEQKVKAQFEIKIEGYFIIRQGKRVVKAKNKPTWNVAYTFGGWLWDRGTVYGGSVSWTIGIGSDQVNPTTVTMNDLAVVISKSPNSKAQLGVTHVGNGRWRVRWRATWNSGTVSGTIGEIGLFLRNRDGNMYMWFRSCVADGTLTAYTIDTTKALNIEYWIDIFPTTGVTNLFTEQFAKFMNWSSWADIGSPLDSWRIVIGPDQVNPTTPFFYDIPVPFVDANFYLTVTFMYVADGWYRVKVAGVWVAYRYGENKTVGDIALYMYNDFDADRQGTFFRICVADGTLTAFTWDYTKPLVVEFWVDFKVV